MGRGSIAWTLALAACTGDDAATHGATDGTTTAETTTDAAPVEGCERRDPGDMSKAGFRWSLGCEGPYALPGLAHMDDDGVAVVYAVFGASPVDLGGDTFMVDGMGEVVIGRYDGSGHHVWSESIETGIDVNPAFVGALPGGGMVTVMQTSAPVTLGGVTQEVDPSGASAVVFALDPDGSHRWSAVVAGSSGATVRPYWMKTSPAGVSALWIGSHDPVWFGEEGPFEPDVFGRLLILFAADGAVLRAAHPPDGEPLALVDDGSMLLDNGKVVRTDAAWEVAWSFTIGGGARGSLFGALAPNGDVAIATTFDYMIDLGGGVFENNEPVFPGVSRFDVALARYTAEGSHVWSAARNDAQFILDIGVDAGGAMTAALVTDELSVRIEHVDPAGAALGDLRTPSVTDPRAGVVTPGGGAVLQGFADKAVNLGGGEMPLHGDLQIWLARYAP